VDIGAGFSTLPAAPVEAPAEEALPTVAIEVPAVLEPLLVEAVPESADLPTETPATGVDGPPLALPGRAVLGRRTSSRVIGTGTGSPAASPARTGPPGGGGYVPAAPWPGNARPDYPPASLARGVEGDVWLLVRVGATGLVEDVAVERSSGHGDLDEAAVHAIATWRFEPASSSGTPVAESLRVPLRFRLR